MRVIKQDDGWWIVDVPGYWVDGVRHESCGPYLTKAAAVDDKRGLESFFRQPSQSQSGWLLPLADEQDERQSGRSAGGSIAFRPPRPSARRKLRPGRGQLLLPGITDL
jgi:hypothetical protein